MNKKRRKELLSAYAPGLPISKFPLLRREQSLQGILKKYCQKPKQVCRKPSALSADVYCSQELAFEIISRNYHQDIKEKHVLLRAEYTGNAFLLVAEGITPLLDAVNDLRTRLQTFKPAKTKPVNTGTAEDLINFPFTDTLQYVGDQECLFCGFPFVQGQKVRRTPCLHLFHMKCLESWIQIKAVCPIDKMPINILP